MTTDLLSVSTGTGVTFLGVREQAQGSVHNAAYCLIDCCYNCSTAVLRCHCAHEPSGRAGGATRQPA
jgi:hypothetical protein